MTTKPSHEAKNSEFPRRAAQHQENASRYQRQHRKCLLAKFDRVRAPVASSHPLEADPGRGGRLARRALALAGAGLLAAGLGLAAPAASAGTSPPAPRNWHVQVGAQTPDGAIQTTAYYPSHLYVDQGDEVTWTAGGAEIHTVTFLAHAKPCPQNALCAPPPASGFDQRFIAPQGGPSYNGSSYYNSGVFTTAVGPPLPPGVVVVRTYTLRFPRTLALGTYSYFCLIHGIAMKGTITVRAPGTPYPFGQLHPNPGAQHADLADGLALWAGSRRQALSLSRPNHPTVLVGAMDSRAMVMRFINPNITVKAGGTVTFLDTSMGEPHTVSFGNDFTGCGKPPCDPAQPWNVAPQPSGNLSASYPALNRGFTGSPTNLNTGFMFGLPFALTHLPSTLTLHLTQPGQFRFHCAIHDYMGMARTIVVQP